MAQTAPQSDMQELREYTRIFFVGIGGISMSGLAELAASSGYQVAGSDRVLSDRTEYLVRLGVPIFSGHSAEWIDRFQPDLVVHTAAVHDDNPELIRARTKGIGSSIGRLFLVGSTVSLAGSSISRAHTAKTTTTAMCSLILMAAGIDPTVHLGAELDPVSQHGSGRQTRRGYGFRSL